MVKGGGCEGEMLGSPLNKLGTLRVCGMQSATRLPQHFLLNVETGQSSRATDATRNFH